MPAPARRETEPANAMALRARLSAWLPRQPAVADWRSFYRAWRRSPRQVGAMAPSSQALARAMTRHIGAATGTVLDLGSGTGVFARAALARGVAECDLVLVERDPQFTQVLRERFPAAQVLLGDAAARVASVWPAVAAPPGAIVCGLPLLNMGPRQQIRVMRGAFSVLPADGALVLFTYGLRSPLRPALLARLGLQAVRQETVMANMPPAHVWRVTRLA